MLVVGSLLRSFKTTPIGEASQNIFSLLRGSGDLFYKNEASDVPFYASTDWNHTMVDSIHQSEQVCLQEGIRVRFEL